MATSKINKSTKSDAFKSLVWLIEAAFRGFTGWALLTNFDNIATTTVGVYALATAVIIIAVHFIKAHK